MDEAYLDVTENKMGLSTATRMEKSIREQIQMELQLTASAGVAPNKFLAKIASDWRKPNGQFVSQPHEAQSLLLPLPVGRIPGVGRVTEERMKHVGVATVGDLYAMDISTLENHFGRYGQRLYELARGIDHSPVVGNRPSKSLSAQDTFESDSLRETEPVVRKPAEEVRDCSKNNARMARTIVLKLKTKQFQTLSRSLTPSVMPTTSEEFVAPRFHFSTGYR